jgi:hypothetical protein
MPKATTASRKGEIQCAKRRVVQSMLELMYDEKDRAFYDLKKPSSARSACVRTHFFPLALDDVEQRIAEHFFLSSCATRRSTLERAFIQRLLICMLN